MLVFPAKDIEMQFESEKYTIDKKEKKYNGGDRTAQSRKQQASRLGGG